MNKPQLLTLDKAVSMCKTSLNPCGIKTPQSIYLDASTSIIAGAMGNERKEDIIGRTDFDFPNTARFAEHYVSCDQLVLQGSPWAGIEPIAWEFLGNINIFTIKVPVYDHSQTSIVAIFYTCFLMNSTNFTKHMLASMGDTNKKVGWPSDNRYRVDHPSFPASSYQITPRESTCLFYLLRGKSAKEIGVILNISNRTVESHIENLKKKFQCHYKSELIDKAIALGFLNVVPYDFLAI